MSKRPTREDNVNRFWSKVKKTDACWEWTAHTNKSGYCYFKWNGSKYLVHRISMWLSGKIKLTFEDHSSVVDHICKNKVCVNPLHLRVVSQRVNSLENSNGIGAINSKKTHCLNGHQFSKENTRIAKSKNERICRTCRKERAQKYRDKLRLINVL